jgi:hypothetical protein
MVLLSINDLKKSQKFIQNIRWDITPRIFLDPGSAPGDKPVDTTHGYMLYVDLFNDKPTLVIMQLKSIMSNTVGYVSDIPENLLREAMNCNEEDCIAGMYPLTKDLEEWLKKEFGLS